MKPTLILTVGLPRSGKSTWARQQGYPVVSPDAIREALHGQRFVPSAESAVWMIARYMVDALFIAAHDTVILDATNATEERRAEWQSDRWRIAYKSFRVSPEICIERAISDGRPDLVPVIERMARRLVWPTPSEGEGDAGG